MTAEPEITQYIFAEKNKKIKAVFHTPGPRLKFLLQKWNSDINADSVLWHKVDCYYSVDYFLLNDVTVRCQNKLEVTTINWWSFVGGCLYGWIATHPCSVEHLSIFSWSISMSALSSSDILLTVFASVTSEPGGWSTDCKETRSAQINALASMASRTSMWKALVQSTWRQVPSVWQFRSHIHIWSGRWLVVAPQESSSFRGISSPSGEMNEA